MKTVKIELADEDADAFDRAATDAGFASSSDLVLAAIGDLVAAPNLYDPDALARDVADHGSAKSRGDVGFTPEEARAWLGAARSPQGGVA